MIVCIPSKSSKIVRICQKQTFLISENVFEHAMYFNNLN